MSLQTNQSPVTRVTDIVPRELLTPLPQGLYYGALKQFVCFAAPIGMSIIFAVTAGVLLWSIAWMAAMAFSIGALASLLLFFVWDAYKCEQYEIECRRTDHTRIIMSVRQVINNIEIINVNKGGVFNAGVSQPMFETPALPSVSDEIPTINTTYQLALKIMQVAIGSWAQNKNVRPKTKPISVERMTSAFKVGNEAWNHAMQLLGDSEVLHDPFGVRWKPLVGTQEEGIKLLNTHMNSLGYFISRQHGKEIWLR